MTTGNNHEKFISLPFRVSTQRCQAGGNLDNIPDKIMTMISKNHFSDGRFLVLSSNPQCLLY